MPASIRRRIRSVYLFHENLLEEDRTIELSYGEVPSRECSIEIQTKKHATANLNKISIWNIFNSAFMSVF